MLDFDYSGVSKAATTAIETQPLEADLFAVLKWVAGILFAVGLYFILADILKLPTVKSSRAITNISKRQKNTTSFIEVWGASISAFIARTLPMNEFKKQELEQDLRTAQLDVTPEMYRASAITKALVPLVLAIPLTAVWWALGIFAAAVAPLIYYVSMREVKLRIKAKRDSIERDLPRLVATVERKLTHERGVLGIIESFIPSCSPQLAQELEITAADMRSGNEESAITRLEARVGSPMMSDVCRGFITMIHGDSAIVYWSSIEQKFADIQRNRLRAEASKIPGKVHKLSLVMLICFIGIIFLTIMMSISDSLSVLF